MSATSKMLLSSAILLLTGAVSALTPALAQRQIDDPRLSPMLFGETEKKRREKIRKAKEEREEALRISQEQDRDARQIDDPKVRPLLFGAPYPGGIEEDPVGGRITLGEDDNNRGFFGALTFLVPEETNLSLGVGPVYKPDYFGSDDYEYKPDPQVFIKIRNFVFLDDDGADFALLGFSGVRIGPSMRIKGRRKELHNPALQGLGDVGMTFEFGGFIATTFLDRFSIKAKIRHGLKTGHRGTIIDGNLTALLFRAGPISVSTSGHASWVGDKYADVFFSVTPEQSTNSNGVLSVYDANAGLRDVGGSVNGYINIGRRWSLNPYVSYSYIFDDFAATPIINQFGDRRQFRVGFHVMREFTFGGEK